MDLELRLVLIVLPTLQKLIIQRFTAGSKGFGSGVVTEQFSVQFPSFNYFKLAAETKNFKVFLLTS